MESTFLVLIIPCILCNFATANHQFLRDGRSRDKLPLAQFPSETDTLAYVDALKHSNFSQWRSLEQVAKTAGGGSCSGAVNTSVLTALYLLGLFNLCSASPASCCVPPQKGHRKRRSSGTQSVDDALPPLLNSLTQNLTSLSLEQFGDLPRVSTPQGGRVPVDISVVEQVRKLWDTNPRLLSNIPCRTATEAVRSSFISLSGVASGIILAYSIAQVNQCYPDNETMNDGANKIWFFPIPKQSDVSKQYVVESLPREMPLQGEDDPSDDCDRTAVRMKNGNCAPLLSTRVCPYMQWVLLNRNTGKGECVPRLCSAGKVFVEYDQMCHSVNEPGFCPKNQRLYLTAWGEAVCDCKDGMFYGADNQCHRIYEQSYCHRGSVLQFHKHTKTLKCNVDSCREFNDLSVSSQLPFAKLDNTCVQFGSQGPCDNSERFGFDIEELEPSCVSLKEAGLIRPQRSYQYSHMSFPSLQDKGFPNYEVSYVIRNGSTWELNMKTVGREKRDIRRDVSAMGETVIPFLDTRDFPTTMDGVTEQFKGLVDKKVLYRNKSGLDIDKIENVHETPLRNNEERRLDVNMKSFSESVSHIQQPKETERILHSNDSENVESVSVDDSLLDLFKRKHTSLMTGKQNVNSAAREKVNKSQANVNNSTRDITVNMNDIAGNSTNLNEQIIAKQDKIVNTIPTIHTSPENTQNYSIIPINSEEMHRDKIPMKGTKEIYVTMNGIAGNSTSVNKHNIAKHDKFVNIAPTSHTSPENSQNYPMVPRHSEEMHSSKILIKVFRDKSTNCNWQISFYSQMPNTTASSETQFQLLGSPTFSRFKIERYDLKPKFSPKLIDLKLDSRIDQISSEEQGSGHREDNIYGTIQPLDKNANVYEVTSAVPDINVTSTPTPEFLPEVNLSVITPENESESYVNATESIVVHQNISIQHLEDRYDTNGSVRVLPTQTEMPDTTDGSESVLSTQTNMPYTTNGSETSLSTQTNMPYTTHGLESVISTQTNMPYSTDGSASVIPTQTDRSYTTDGSVGVMLPQTDRPYTTDGSENVVPTTTDLPYTTDGSVNVVPTTTDLPYTTDGSISVVPTTTNLPYTTDGSVNVVPTTTDLPYTTDGSISDVPTTTDLPYTKDGSVNVVPTTTALPYTTDGFEHTQTNIRDITGIEQTTTTPGQSTHSIEPISPVKQTTLTSVDKYETTGQSTSIEFSTKDIPSLREFEITSGKFSLVKERIKELTELKNSNASFSQPERDLHLERGIVKITQHRTGGSNKTVKEPKKLPKRPVIAKRKFSSRHKKRKRKRRKRKKLNQKQSPKRSNKTSKRKKNQRKTINSDNKMDRRNNSIYKLKEKGVLNERNSSSKIHNKVFHESLPDYLRNRGRRQAGRKRGIRLNPGIINAPLLNQCRPGAKRDYNGHCRAKIIPLGTVPLPRVQGRARSYKPTPPRMKCIGKSRLDARGVCRTTFSGLG